MIVIGLDPGTESTLALVDSEKGWIEYADGDQTSSKAEPKRGQKSTTRRVPERDRIADTLRYWIAIYEVDYICIEHVHAFANQGLVSTANFVGSARLAEGIACGLGLHIHLVRPAKWKRAMGLSSDKSLSLTMARRLWPDRADDWLRLKKSHDRAEAALLAQYYINLQTGKMT